MFLYKVTFTLRVLTISGCINFANNMGLSVVRFFMTNAVSLVLTLVFSLGTLSLGTFLCNTLPVLCLNVVSDNVTCALRLINRGCTRTSVTSVSVDLRDMFTILNNILFSGNVLSRGRVVNYVVVFTTVVITRLPPVGVVRGGWWVVGGIYL